MHHRSSLFRLPNFLPHLCLVLLSAFSSLGQAQETRPAGNTGTGFFSKNGKIYDKNGAEFVIRGINHTLWWGDEAHNHESITSPNGLVKTGANLVRAVFGPNGGADTPPEMRTEVESLINQKLVPLIERHDATGNDTATNDVALQNIVDNIWLNPANVQLLKDFQDKIILNIANEWGPNSTVWRDGYKTAVSKLRAAGIKCLIVIDAGGDFGQDYSSIVKWGQEIVTGDPQHNVAFSLHIYGFWVSQNRNAALAGTWGPPANDPWLFEQRMDELRNTGLSILVGEFSSDAAEQVLYKTQDVLNYCQTNHIGWIAWSWNQNAGDGLHPMDMLTFSGGVSHWLWNTDADLTGFGAQIIKGTNGLQQTSVRPNIFGGSGDALPPSQPTGLTATGVSATSFVLSWTASTDNVGVLGYDILRGQTSINPALVTGTTFTVTGLSPATTYAISVRARDAAGNQSTLSAVLNVTTAAAPVDTQPPSVPTGLVASNVSSTGLTLSWNGSSDDTGVSGYDVYSGSTKLNTSTIAGTTYPVTGLSSGTMYALTVKAKDAAGNQSAASAILSVTTSISSLPSPWSTQDIGNTAIAGSASALGSVYTVTASGSDIWGSADAFRYVYRNLTGAAQITVRVTSLTNSNAWAKAGLMIRDSLAANAAYVNLCVTPSNGISLQRRTGSGASSDQVLNVAGSAPVWLRLTRSGNTFTASKSADGVSWTPVGSTTCVIGDSAFVGLALSAHTNTATTMASFDNFATSAVDTPPTTGGSTVINFSALAAGLLPNPYTDPSGYILSGAYSTTGAPDPLRVSTLNGNKILINNNWSSRIILTKASGGAFSLISLKYASDPWGGLADAVVTGTTASGGTLVSNYTATSTTFQTLLLNWSNLTKVVIEFNTGANSSYGMIDDLTLAP